MNAKDYKTLCIVVADLNIALAALDDRQNKDIKNPKKIAYDRVQKAYLIIDKMLIKKANYDKQ